MIVSFSCIVLKHSSADIIIYFIKVMNTHCLVVCYRCLMNLDVIGDTLEISHKLISKNTEESHLVVDNVGHVVPISF